MLSFRTILWPAVLAFAFGCTPVDIRDGDGSQDDSLSRRKRDGGAPSVDASPTPDASTGGTGGGGTGGTGGGGTGGGGTGGTTGLSLYDNFNGPLYTITSDGVLSPNGLWRSGYVSGGFIKTVQDPTDGSNQVLQTSPKLDVLRATRVDSTHTWKGIHGRLRARLDAQLQPPVSWYTLWPLIAYVNETTHYYFNLKTNGWELGKKDNDHPPAEELQEYLATGSTPKAVIGQWYTIEWWVLPVSGNMRIRVDVDGVQVVDMLDNQGWQRNGTTGTGASSFFISADKKVTLYNEGSQISWDDVFVSEATTIP